MKLSVSLSDADVAILDRYMDDRGVSSRSAAVQIAIRQLARQDLAGEYAAAWSEWEDCGEADSWDATVADGLGNAPR